MIERLLRMQTIDGPYLGPTRPLEATAAPRAVFQVPEAKAALAPQPLKLQSLGQQLHIQQAHKTVAQQQQHMQQSVQQIARQSLQPVTLQALQQHGVSSVLGLSAQELFLLSLLKPKSGGKTLTGQEQWVPNASAQLSFIHTPRTFLHTLPRARQLRLRGISFMTFRFQWESEETTDEAGMLE